MSRTKHRTSRPGAAAERPAADRPAAMTGQRVDGPHQLGTAPATAAPPVEHSPVVVVDDADAATMPPPAPLFVEVESGPDELMQAQAEELAAHLRARQRDLDQREAQFNAALARFDHDARKMRLVADERQQELAERQAAIDAGERELADRASRLAAAEQFLDAARRDGEEQLAARTAELSRQEKLQAAATERLGRQEAACLRQAEVLQAERERAAAELLHQRQQLDARRAGTMRFVQLLLDAQDRRRATIEHASERVAHERREALAEIALRESELRQTVGLWQMRERRLLEAEAAHGQEQADLAEERRELEQWHAGALARLEDDRRAAAARLAEAEEELSARRQTLERRAEQLDARRIALDQQLEEVRRLHREGLEARLAGEELWVQLSATASSATLTRSLSRTRAQLTDQYRLANAELAARKQELEELSARLEQRFSQVHAERSDVQQWVARRQEELERQAAQLVEQEQELEHQTADLRAQRLVGNEERREYQRQIHHLREELRSPAAA